MTAGEDPVSPPHSGDADWSQWMRQAQAGDRETYQRLLRSIVPYLSAIARRHLRDADGVEDAVQDILMIVHGVRHTYEPERPFKPWLATIARRHCIDLERRRQRRTRHETRDEDAIAVRPGEDPTPEDVLRDAQAAHGVRDAISQLTPRQREALQLLRLEELSLREASAASRQSIPALKVASHRALKALRHLLQARGDLP